MALLISVPVSAEWSWAILRGSGGFVARHLAELYGVLPRALVQAVKRNADRFPSDFMFQLSDAEFKRMGVPLGERVNVSAFSEGQRRYLEFHQERLFLEARVKT